MEITCITEELARHCLRDIEPGWRRFWFHMHLMVKNLPEFAEGMGQIADDVYAYHHSGQKNDFAAWVQDVVGDADLARSLQNVTGREEATRICQERVAELRRVIG